MRGSLFAVASPALSSRTLPSGTNLLSEQIRAHGLERGHRPAAQNTKSPHSRPSMTDDKTPVTCRPSHETAEIGRGHLQLSIFHGPPAARTVSGTDRRAVSVASNRP